MVLYACFWEFKPEDMDNVIPVFQKMVELRGTSGYPKATTPTYAYYGETGGFTIYDIKDPKEVELHYTHYHPYIKFTWKPLYEASELFGTYLKNKKR